MSAIFGLVTLNDRPVTKEELERMSAALVHHGADGNGVWTRGNVGLGQRLMRFTLEDQFEANRWSAPMDSACSSRTRALTTETS